MRTPYKPLTDEVDNLCFIFNVSWRSTYAFSGSNCAVNKRSCGRLSFIAALN